MLVHISTRTFHGRSLIKPCVKRIFLLIPLICVLRFYFEFSSRVKRTEETLIAPLRTNKLYPIRHEKDQVLRQSTESNSIVVHDMNSYASKHQSSYLPSYSSKYRYHRKTYDYEANMLKGVFPRPYQFDDNLYLDI
jgi:hypothetical protein